MQFDFYCSYVNHFANSC